VSVLKIISAVFFITCAQLCLAAEPIEQANWQATFTKFNAKGTLVISDERVTPAKLLVFNQERAKQRMSPASTFKIPHSLMALDAGVLKDEFQLFRWDGVERSFAGHNQDQNLRSAMRTSALWVYEIFAKQIGEKRAGEYLQKIGYGNANPSTDKGTYWVDGKLAISAEEQIAFLKKLYLNQLPFAKEHQLLVKDMMINEAGKEWILRAKTGWEGRFGWWVGYVEWPTGPVFFALNIDTPERMADLYKREAIVRDILQSMGALPAATAKQ
jgi:beta-lactamase class D